MWPSPQHYRQRISVKEDQQVRAARPSQEIITRVQGAAVLLGNVNARRCSRILPALFAGTARALRVASGPEVALAGGEISPHLGAPTRVGDLCRSRTWHDGGVRWITGCSGRPLAPPVASWWMVLVASDSRFTMRRRRQAHVRAWSARKWRLLRRHPPRPLRRSSTPVRLSSPGQRTIVRVCCTHATETATIAPPAGVVCRISDRQVEHAPDDGVSRRRWRWGERESRVYRGITTPLTRLHFRIRDQFADT
jgi:hypothetical protein